MRDHLPVNLLRAAIEETHSANTWTHPRETNASMISSLTGPTCLAISVRCRVHLLFFFAPLEDFFRSCHIISSSVGHVMNNFKKMFTFSLLVLMLFVLISDSFVANNLTFSFLKKGTLWVWCTQCNGTLTNNQ